MGVALLGLAAYPTRIAAQTGQTDEYLPLTVGARWELRSAATPTPMVFEVTRQDGDAFVVRWDNPWTKAEFRFVRAGRRILLAGLDMGAGVAPMPAGTVYFDFAAAAGARWSNAIGNQRVVSRERQVTTSGRTYERCIEIHATDRQGTTSVWIFAPGVGFVQFGEGRDAFRLTSFWNGGSPVTRRAPPGGDRPDNRILIGLDFNPPPKEGFEEPAKRRAFKRSIDAGVTVIKVTPTWAAVEPGSGSYDFADLDFHVSLAEEYDLPIYLNLRVIDTNHKSVPPAYEKLSFDDPQLVDRLQRVLRAIAPRTKGRIRWVVIGNEVDAYLKSRSVETAAYGRMLDLVRTTVREAFSQALLTVNFTRDAAGDLSSRYRSITSGLTAVSFTYYPLNFNFTMKSPSVAEADIRGMLNAAEGRPVLFQEIGYASAERLNSSEQKQAEFYRNAFSALRGSQSQVIAGFFLFMSDLPADTVDELTRYYRLPLFRENFRAYLGTLGLFDREGRAKPAWDEFRKHAREFAGESARR